MSAIDISTRETVCGITLSLSVSVSPEALLHDLGALYGPDEFSNIPVDLAERLSLEVSLETARTISALRSKLHLNFLSTCNQYLEEELVTISAGPRDELAAELLENFEKFLKEKGVLK